MRHPPPPPPWIVEEDPERMFRGAFSVFDLKFTARLGYWPEGIRFRNARTGAVAHYWDGCLYINGKVAARRQQSVSGGAV